MKSPGIRRRRRPDEAIPDGETLAGDSVVLRNTGLFVGEVVGTPHVVIQDTDDLVVLFRPEGTRWAVWDLERQQFKEVPPTRMDMLRLMVPGRGYAVELYFDTGRGAPYGIFAGAGRFRGWKVNIEAPFRRTAVGFDTIDDILDLFVNPDGSYYWTDEDELTFWVNVGGYWEEDRRRFFNHGFEAETLIKARQSPFDGEWIDWQPPADVGLPTLAEGWQFEPGAEITLSTGRRFDAWREGQDVEAVIQAWWHLLDSHRDDPLRRRFVPKPLTSQSE
jgi:hypothetical protein